MAFYPDELSPIDRIRNLSKPTDLPDISLLKNRRQWKSLVLGKKDMGLNNFATITEEKEEEISSEGSQGSNSNKGSNNCLNGVTSNKKIMFPKPRKYITSRGPERREDENLKSPVLSKEPQGIAKQNKNFSETSSKTNALESKQLKAKKSREFVPTKVEFIQNYALNEIPLETQWNEAVLESGYPKPVFEKIDLEYFQNPKSKQEDKKKSSGNVKPSTSDVTKHELKPSKKKPGSLTKKGGQTLKTAEEASPGKTVSSKSKQKTEKGKSLNMKDVVNVYKNLAYGSKEEIKSFVEKLSFVKDETENDKNLLSVMNLKALENKIKNFTKKTSKCQKKSLFQEKKSTPVRKNRKAHIDRLARHKVVRVPAVANHAAGNYSRSTFQSPSESKSKSSPAREKEPWKYVGMQSILDKTYFVYPAYPPSINLKKGGKKKKNADGKAEGSSEKNTKVKQEPVKVEAPKVKASGVVIRKNMLRARSSATRSENTLNLSMSNKSMSRPSATTVCTVEFQPAVGERFASGDSTEPTDPSLLVYLHGTKAINVKSPYSDKQFSRVKFFRKDGRGKPLIKGLDQKVLPKDRGNVTVRTISLPGRVRSLDLLDFEEDIQNITDFLRSQNSPRQEEHLALGKSERDSRSREPAKHSRQQRRTGQYQHYHHHHQHQHQHGTLQETLSPDSIIDEISKNIEHLQYLPDTEENRKMIAEFFDELDHRIEASKRGTGDFQKFPLLPNSFRPIPILGY